MADIIACVEHHEIDDMAGGLGEIEQLDDVGFDFCVGSERLGFTAAVDDGAGDPRNFGFRTPGNNDPMAFNSESPGQRGAKPLFGTDPDNDSGAKRTHRSIFPPDSIPSKEPSSICIGRLAPPMLLG